MKILAWAEMFCEYLGGSRDELPPGAPAFLATWWFAGLWWGLLAVTILLFCGQTSKFIYIDF
ncbi:conserved hypothetical protein [Verrucomicrobia bacterium]|nr:conserved hypothetical protein [Verrucomicrobiota bacterium]